MFVEYIVIINNILKSFSGEDIEETCKAIFRILGKVFPRVVIIYALFVTPSILSKRILLKCCLHDALRF